MGMPQTATFGGVTRARISSQCLKRAIRLYAKELCPDLYAGERAKLIV
jgi:CRISPR system Cascade subunit CasC